MTDPDSAATPMKRYVPLVVHLGVWVTLFLIPWFVVRLGFAPPDDALRHVGKVLSGKNWNEILVLRDGVTIDHNAGWHALLGAVHRATGWEAEGLLLFSVVSLATIYLLLPLLFSGRVEAWAAALLAVMVCNPHYAFRLLLGRPFILTMALFMAILHAWRRCDYKPRIGGLAVTTLLIAIAAWVHGGWYLYWLPAAGLLLAQRWRAGVQMLACWMIGSVLAGLLTGHPLHFLVEQFKVLVSCFSSYTPMQRMLVTEFLPTDGAFTLVALTVILVLARRVAGQSVRTLLNDPWFMLAGLGWVLGLLVRRFWLDWGMLALLVWITVELKRWIERLVDESSFQRVVFSGFVGLALLLAVMSDLDNRWTRNLTKEYLSPDTPDIGDWLPEPGGILYADSMPVFYDTFYKNPKAPWRYILGFEATFMPAEDLEIYRKIQWNLGNPAAYEPWIDKMRPEDRLVLKRSAGARPNLPRLEWKYAAADTWIGRLPRNVSAPSPAETP